MSKLSPKLQAISDERERVYGDPELSHDAIGAVWGAILSRFFKKDIGPLPAYLVALMMAALKIMRSITAYKDDNFDDLHVYATFAEDFQKLYEEKRNAGKVEKSELPRSQPLRAGANRKRTGKNSPI